MDNPVRAYVQLEATTPSGLTGGMPALEATERENWLRPSEAAELFVQAGLWRIPRSTFCAWADRAGITFKRTPGRQRRYAESEVRALVAAMDEAA